MAEFVEKRIQETIPEVEEMERIGLLSKEEVKKLIEKRREHLYRLARRSRNKRDYISFAKYEQKLIELIKIRRKQMGIDEKARKIDLPISLRVMKHLRFLTRFWPSHLDTWALRISFASFIGWKEEISTAFLEQVRYHGNNESVWVMWAKWEVEDRGNFDRARTILLSKASLYHPKSLVISRELFRLELLYIESLKIKAKIDNIAGLEEITIKNRNKVLNCAVAKAVYKNIIATLPDPEVYVQLYQVASKFTFAHTLRDEIFRDLCTNFPDAYCVWKVKAQRLVTGIQQEDMEDIKQEVNSEPNVDDFEMKSESVPKSPVVLNPMQMLEGIISTFDKALSVSGPLFVNIYVRELLPLLCQCWSVESMAKMVLSKIHHICQNNISVLTPLNFYVWLQVSREQDAPGNQLCDILDTALEQHPDMPLLRLERVKLITKLSKSDGATLKEFQKLGAELDGKIGLAAWQEILKQVENKNVLLKVLKQAADHEDLTVSIGMKSQYMKHVFLNKGIKETRNIYKKYSCRPPLSTRFHAQMVELELTQSKVEVEEVRKIFKNATQQHGTKHPGLWLAYIQFEKQYGDPCKAGALFTRAETELEAAQAQLFRQLNLIIRDIQSKKSAASQYTEDDADGTMVIEVIDNEDLESEGLEWVGKGLVSLFAEEPILPYTANQARISFFSSLATMDKHIAKSIHKDSPKSEDGSEWEEVLKTLLNHHVPLSIHQLKNNQLKQAKKHQQQKFPIMKTKQGYKPSDCLDPETDQQPRMSKFGHESQVDEVAKALESSAVLKPEFMQKTMVEPAISKKKAKELRRSERAKTKGPGWFNMKAPELTEEVKRDLEVLQMRSVLDPRRHFKTSDMKVLPKYFQIGTVMDSPLDFYSSRVPKKKRKRTLAEEILHDEEALRYQKRKYTEIVATKEKMKMNKAARKYAKKGSKK
ncbi:hypothetical protein Pmani_019034 [Petrolisthes manimaculis]|uniref:U3 small nucleolar RNA-associated protein 6 homolog n=1 Tax=Petrolisthes manimaculis TaxID=1843537 RepID=A0AAE1PJP4_9EUCA|nr:hypothetical protein Pmani_019034 [Petrolisthes manimaculis]